MGVSENALLERARGYLLRVVVLAALTLLMTLLYAAAPAWADTFTVTNLNDSGPGSLREAIEAAEANAGADEIVFADGVSGTITLASTLPTVADPEGLVIDGGGDVTVSGDSDVRVFAVGEGAALTLSDLTVSDGFDFSWGGGIYNEGGMVMVSRSTFSSNYVGDYGGAIMNRSPGTVEVKDSTFLANEAADSGGGIANFGTLLVSGSTFSSNYGHFEAGGIFNEGGTVNVINSTFTGNDGGMFGGGAILSFGGMLEVTNSTVSGNIGTGEGACGGICGSGKTLRNTIVADNAGGNCAGPITDAGYNVEDADTCGLTEATGSLPNTNPLLDPAGLADNGGPTQTIALLPDSPAVDLVAEGACPPPETDQRGVERPQGEACDAGAFELVQGPQTKADCKQGGWEEFGFKNQGQCIASLQREQVQTSQ